MHNSITACMSHYYPRYRLRADLRSALNRYSVQPLIRARIPDALFVQLFPPEDGHVKARNMSRIVM